VIENTIGVLHNTSDISENTRKNGCVIIESDSTKEELDE
jgi:hypothetical protein